MNALQAGAEVADTVRTCATAPSERSLVVTLADVDLSGFDATLYRLPDSPPSGHDPWLPFADQAFDTVLLYRVTSHDTDMQLLLGETSRVLHPAGHVLMLEHPDDFSFAPLPDAGPAHLLSGWLREAGFAHVDFPVSAGTRLIAVAHP